MGPAIGWCVFPGPSSDIAVFFLAARVATTRLVEPPPSLNAKVQGVDPEEMWWEDSTQGSKGDDFPIRDVRIKVPNSLIHAEYQELNEQKKSSQMQAIFAS